MIRLSCFRNEKRNLSLFIFPFCVKIRRMIHHTLPFGYFCPCILHASSPMTGRTQCIGCLYKELQGEHSSTMAISNEAANCWVYVYVYRSWVESLRKNQTFISILLYAILNAKVWAMLTTVLVWCLEMLMITVFARSSIYL